MPKSRQPQKNESEAFIGSIIDEVTESNPALTWLNAPLKAIISDMYGLDDTSTDPSELILDRLDELETQIKQAETDIKNHVGNIADGFSRRRAAEGF